MQKVTQRHPAVWVAVIAQLCRTSGTRTPVNQYLGEGFKPLTFSLERLLEQ